MNWLFRITKPKLFVFLVVLVLAALFVPTTITVLRGEPAQTEVDDWNPNLPVNTPIQYSRFPPDKGMLSEQRIMFATRSDPQGNANQLWLLNLQSGRLTSVAPQWWPDVGRVAFFKDRLVYQDMNDKKLYVEQLASGQRQSLDEDYEIPEARYPVISNDYVVWRTNYYLRGKDLATGQTFYLAPPFQYEGSIPQASPESRPSMFGNTVAWLGHTESDAYGVAIFLRTLPGGPIKKLLVSEMIPGVTSQRIDVRVTPKIDNRNVLWQAEEWGWKNNYYYMYFNIYVTNASTGDTTLVAKNRSGQTLNGYDPGFDLAENKVVYIASPTGESYSVKVTDLTSGKTITLGPAVPFYFDNHNSIEKVSPSEYLVSYRLSTGLYFMRLTPDYSTSSKTVSEGVVLPGEEFTYTINVRNTGIVEDSDLIVKDTLPEGVEYLSSSFEPSEINGRQLTFDLGPMPPGQSLGIDINVKATAQEETVLTNQAIIAPNKPFKQEVDASAYLVFSKTPPDLSWFASNNGQTWNVAFDATNDQGWPVPNLAITAKSKSKNKPDSDQPYTFEAITDSSGNAAISDTSASADSYSATAKYKAWIASFEFNTADGASGNVKLGDPPPGQETPAPVISDSEKTYIDVYNKTAAYLRDQLGITLDPTFMTYQPNIDPPAILKKLDKVVYPVSKFIPFAVMGPPGAGFFYMPPVDAYSWGVGLQGYPVYQRGYGAEVVHLGNLRGAYEVETQGFVTNAGANGYLYANAIRNFGEPTQGTLDKYKGDFYNFVWDISLLPIGPGVFFGGFTKAPMDENPFDDLQGKTMGVSMGVSGLPMDWQISNIHSDKVYSWSQDEEALTFALLSPADILITDPSGRRAGTDPSTGAQINEIPEAMVSSPKAEPELIIIPSPQEGDYQIQLKGTGNGEFHLKAFSDTSAGGQLQEVASGTISTNQIIQTSYDFEPDAIAPITTINIKPPEPDGKNGWYISTPTVSLESTDNAGGSGIDKTEYSLDGGARWDVYGGSFVISTEGTATILVKSTDKAGNIENPPAEKSLKIDTGKPATPTLSGSAASPTQIDLSWSASSDQISGVSAYGAYNTDTDEKIAETSITAYQIASLQPGTTYTYYIKAYDAAGNASAASNSVSITTPMPTALTSFSDYSSDYSDVAYLKAVLVDINGAPVVGKDIKFSLGGQEVTITTDLLGEAWTFLKIDQPTGEKELTMSYAGDGYYLPSSYAGNFDIDREDTSLSYLGDLITQRYQMATLKAQLSEPDTSLGDLSGKHVAFTITDGLNTQTVYSVTDSNGLASKTEQITVPSGLYNISAKFEGDGFYHASQTADTPYVVWEAIAGLNISGGGWVLRDGEKANFGFTAKYAYNSLIPLGQLEFNDKGTGQNIHADGFDWLVVTLDNLALLQGSASINGQGGHFFRMWVSDLATPGQGKDTFALEIDGLPLTSGVLGGGNIIIH